MKRLKIYESFRTEQEIKDLCSEYEIENHQIRDDGSIDVDGYVNLQGKLGDLKQLPLTFNKIDVYFACGGNNLTTLKGCPKEVRGYFSCSENKLTSLEYSPKIVEEAFYCAYNYITSLEGLETYIGNQLTVWGCSKLYSLKGFPKEVDGFTCRYTPIEPIYNTFIRECDYETMRRFNLFDVIYTDGMDWL